MRLAFQQSKPKRVLRGVGRISYVYILGAIELCNSILAIGIVSLFRAHLDIRMLHQLKAKTKSKFLRLSFDRILYGYKILRIS